jgi:hypothetical protein
MNADHAENADQAAEPAELAEPAEAEDSRSVLAQRRFHEKLAGGPFSKLLLARPHGNAEAGLQRVTVRPIELRGQPAFSFVFSHATRDVTKNFSVEEGLAQVRTLLPAAFKNAHLHTPGEDLQLVFSKRGKAMLSSSRVATVAATGDETATAAQAATVAPQAHDREKQRWLELSSPYLVALGITNAQHQLVPAMSRKWKQINKFVEIFAHALGESKLRSAKQVKVADFGAGRGYLTFAIHDWLRRQPGVQPQVVGVELRPELVAEGNASVKKLGLQGLGFAAGDVRSFDAGSMNVMIALHACDTATDYAIHLGLRAGADIILCSPCCHKQIRPQLLSPHPLRPVFTHGIHAEQQAEMLTDSLRALLLEASGYDTQVFEFIALEHTRKNKMILAVKRQTPRAAEAVWTQIDELKRYFGIREQALETLLRADGVAGLATA